MVETIHASPPPMQPVAVVPPEKPPGKSRRWWWVFPLMVPVSVILALMAGAIFNHVVPEKYEVSAIIEFKPAGRAEMQIHPDRASFLKLKSEDRLSLVSKKLDLANRWMVDESVVLRTLKGIINLEIIRGTDLIAIRVRHTNPEDAMDVANAILEVATEDPQAEVVLHEMPVFPRWPDYPNVLLTLVSAGALGLFASPLLGWILVALLHRLIPVKSNAGSGDASPVRVQASPNQQAPERREQTPVEAAALPSGRKKSRRKKFSFRLHDRTPSKAALLGVASLCLFVGCLIPVIGEPLWRLFTSDGSLNEAASISSSAAAGLPVWLWGLGLGLLLVFVTMVFSLVLVFRSNGSGASKFLAAFVLILLFGGTMAVLVAAGIFSNLSHQRGVSREMMRHEMQRTFAR
jgi:capsular polysaccharide biosynthesis protein